MQKLIWRIVAVVATVALVGGLSAIAARQYAAKEVAQAAQESLKDAVSEAVAERKEAVKVDVAQTAARATAARKVQSVLISHREKDIPHYETTADCRVADADRLRVFIDASREVNRVIDSTAGLP